MRIFGSRFVLVYISLIAHCPRQVLSFPSTSIMRRFLFSTAATPAATAAPSSSTASIATAAAAIKSTAVIQSNPVGDEDVPAAKRSRVEVSSAAEIALPPTSSASSNTNNNLHFNLLTVTQYQLAQNVPTNIWVEYPGIILKLRSSSDTQQQNKAKGVVAFDMDGTIIATKSGKTFAENEFDWKFWNETVPTKLRALHDEGYFLAFISNQGGVGKKKDGAESKAALQRKVDAIMDKLNLPIDFICSFDDDIYRKPRTGMWDFLSVARWQQAIGAACVSQKYVGDAAGRPAHGTRSKDFSDTDLKLALNLGVDFNTPEKFFLQTTQRLHTDVTDNVRNSVRLALLPAANEPYPDEIFHKLGEQEVVLLVAPPASGKTTLSARFTTLGYTRVNGDESGSLKACIQLAKDALTQGKSVVVDNTNTNVATRATWLEIAHLHNAKCRCVVIDIPKDICMLLSTLRLIDPRTPDHDRRKIETVVFHKYFKDLAPPTDREGFDQISKVSWRPSLPSAEEHAVSHRMYHLYLK